MYSLSRSRSWEEGKVEELKMSNYLQKFLSHSLLSWLECLTIEGGGLNELLLFATKNPKNKETNLPSACAGNPNLLCDNNSNSNDNNKEKSTRDPVSNAQVWGCHVQYLHITYSPIRMD